LPLAGENISGTASVDAKQSSGINPIDAEVAVTQRADHEFLCDRHQHTVLAVLILFSWALCKHQRARMPGYLGMVGFASNSLAGIR